MENLLNAISDIGDTWGKFHPLVIHFPIALLFITPLFIVCGEIWKKHQTYFYACTLLILSLGTLGLLLAIKTGEAASELILSKDPSMLLTLNQHLLLAERCQWIFPILTVIWISWLIANNAWKNKISQILKSLFTVAFLGVFFYGLNILFNAAHYGGKLVHHHKISSALYEDH